MTCETCEYYYKEHCCRRDSEHCCELVDKDMRCDKWEAKDDTKTT
jgi:hypothetical protein